MMPPTAFLGRPSRWLTRLHEHRATISGAPNFAYEVCVSRVRDEQISGIDLSSWRLAFNGAEPVSPNTVRRFTRAFRKIRVSTAGDGAGIRSRRSGRVPHGAAARTRAAVRSRRARCVPAPRRSAAGAARRCVRARIRLERSGAARLSAAHRRRRRSRIARSPRRPRRIPRPVRDARLHAQSRKRPQRLFHGNWLDTGDLGYVVGGDLFITSRVKDLIKRAGRNIYPYEVEEAVGNLPGIRKGCVAAFGSSDAVARTEKLVVVAETVETAPDALAALREQHRPRGVGRARLRARRRCAGAARIGTQNVERQDPPRGVPRTVRARRTGPARRRRCRGRWCGSGGAASAGGASDAGCPTNCTRLWARCVFGVLAALVWPAVVLLPSKRMRWRAMRGAARLLFRLTAVPFTRARSRASADAPVRVRQQSCELSRRCCAGGGPADDVFVRRQRRAGAAVLSRGFFSSASAQASSSASMQRKACRMRNAITRVAEERRVGAVLPGGHADAHAGAAAVPHGRVRRGGRSRCADGAGHGTRNAFDPALRHLVRAPRRGFGRDRRTRVCGGSGLACDGATARAGARTRSSHGSASPTWRTSWRRCPAPGRIDQRLLRQ